MGYNENHYEGFSSGFGKIQSPTGAQDLPATIFERARKSDMAVYRVTQSNIADFQILANPEDHNNSDYRGKRFPS